MEEGTPFERWQRAGRLRLPADEAAVEMYGKASQVLTAAGFEHYEVGGVGGRGGGGSSRSCGERSEATGGGEAPGTRRSGNCRRGYWLAGMWSVEGGQVACIGQEDNS